MAPFLVDPQDFCVKPDSLVQPKPQEFFIVEFQAVLCVVPVIESGLFQRELRFFAQRLRDGLDIVDADVLPAVFNARDIGLLRPDPLRQFLLADLREQPL